MTGIFSSNTKEFRVSITSDYVGKKISPSAASTIAAFENKDYDLRN